MRLHSTGAARHQGSLHLDGGSDTFERTDREFACPGCRSTLIAVEPDVLACPDEDRRFQRVDGIWEFLLPERRSVFQSFINDYQTIRRAEGRGSHHPGYFQALPERDLTGKFDADWRIRAKSYRALLKKVVTPLSRQQGRPLDVLDLGSGNGWLSNRLTGKSHDVTSVDLLLNDFDGLGTHRHYETTFTPVQAEFDRLPFPNGAFDLIVYNGSIHYSVDYRTTLAEAMRVLREDGLIVIMDTPVYCDPSSGEQMIREREEQFQRNYGFPSNSLASEGFLTYSRAEDLAVQLGLHWLAISPWYGLHWAARPWKARLFGRREPAQFLLLVGQRAKVPPHQSHARRVLAKLSRTWLRARHQLLQRNRHRSHALEHVAGHPVLVLPDVFNPVLFRSGSFLVETLSPALIPRGSTVLDMGTGSGVGAIAAARWASGVVAVDVNPEAVRCARINALMNRVESRVEVREGDLFVPLQDRRFDVVLFNPPYFRGEPRDAYDRAWRSVETFERFAAGLRDHLTGDGHALLVLSSDGESESFLETLREHRYAIEVVARRDFINERMTVYRVYVNG